MNLRAVELQRNALLELFERASARWNAADESGADPGVHALRELWQRALNEPVQSFLERPAKQFRARLVQTAWLLAGGAPSGPPAELELAVEVLHAGSLIVDDIEDDSERRRGAPTLHRLFGVPTALNTGNLLYCWTLELLAEAGLPPERELALYRRVARAMLDCHRGQALDLSARACDLEPASLPLVVERSTALKAGALMELAADLGAIAAGADPAAAAALRRFGRALGVGLQMLDDLGGIVSAARREKAREDLRLARPTWVWAWLARDLGREAFAELQRHARRVAAGADPDPLVERIAARIGVVGSRRVHDHLIAASFAVAQTFARGPGAEHLALLRAEIRRLEESYA